jgi:Uma2 family endonuclease
MSVKQLMTVDQLWEMPEVPGERFELVNGELVELPGATLLHGLIAALIYRLIDSFASERGLGLTVGDGVAYALQRDPAIVRIPDVSFISRARVPGAGMLDEFVPFAPDLAVEIVSRNDRAMDVRAKVREYLAAGTRPVWVLWPDDRSVTAYTADVAPRELGPDGMLDGGDVLPGFQVRVGELFEIEWPCAS